MSDHVKGIVEKVRALSEPLVLQEGMELVDVEYVRDGSRWVLRLFLDKPGGVTLDDCSAIARQLDTLLDVEEVIEAAFALEVSSPGIERPLRTVAHFERFTGRQVELKTFAPIGDPPRKNFRGKLLGITREQVIQLEIDGQHFDIPHDKVAKAHLAFDFEAFEAHQGPGIPAKRPGGES